MSRFRLHRDQAGYCLTDSFLRQKPLRVSFDQPEFIQRLQQAGRRNELVARAVKAGADVRVLDCTAGLGRDAFVLAHLGCEVTLVERSRVLATLLADGFERAADNAFLSGALQRVSLLNCDARSVLKGQADAFDVIYLDPMFPEKPSTAAVKGPMQHLQRFLGSDEDALELLRLALASECRRIVLKRPPRGDWLSPEPPTHVFTNKNSRYEVFSR